MASSSSRPLLLLPLVLLLFSPPPSLAAKVASEFLYPGFNGSYFAFVDNSHTFLSSPPFAAVFYNPGAQSSRNYVAVLHTISGAAVWIANPASPVPSSGSTLSLTPAGLVLTFPNGTRAWSTPTLLAPVAALQLLPSGELRLISAANESLWTSFDQPTDTLLPNQLLPVSASLTSATDDTDPTPGDYRLLVTPNDVVLRWVPTSQVYWSLASDPRSTKDSNSQVAYLSVNATGLYLLDGDRTTAIFRLIFPPSSSSFTNEFHIAKLDSTGRFQIMSFSPNGSMSANAFDTDFVAPSNNCDLPFICGSLKLCAAGGNGTTCICAASFGTLPNGGCSPADGSVLATSSCRGDHESYVNLGSRIGYFGYKFSKPSTSGANFSACRDLCSANCSCLGFFYQKSSLSCYILEHQIGSLFTLDAASDDPPPSGYIKTISQASPSSHSSSSSPARLIIVLLPSTATFLLVICLFCICLAMWRRKKQRGKPMSKTKSVASGLRWPMTGEFSDEEEEKVEEISIPGLPTRYTFAELEDATNNFQTRIGSGGFGCVFKGQLPDKSLVAVKRIDAVSTQGRREFCTEIAVIGNIHHVNLVRLRGFCTQGPRRLLVYEYMNRSSLDRALFGCGPVLEWRERLDIAIGASRGLAYLHAGCQQRIIHCDVKPENILLHDHSQVKIADFGLAKLMSPEQSGLFTTMRGTRGYLAPEWLTNAAISDKTDVYSFGMVLLEIVRGRKNRAEESEPAWTGSSGSAGSGRSVAYFPMVSLEMHERRTYCELADPRLEGRVEWAEMERVVRVALCCLHEEPALRPSMTAVAAMLEGTMPAAEPRSESLEYLRLYGRGTRDPNPATRGSATATSTTTAGSSVSPLLSYVSSQEVSGPR